MPCSEAFAYPEVPIRLFWNIPLAIRSALDVGAGLGVMGVLLCAYRKLERLTAIEIFEPYARTLEELHIYDQVLRHDLRDLPLPLSDSSYDLVICISVLEHLEKKQGLELLQEFKRIGRRLIVTVPQGVFPQEVLDENPFQRHLSEWYLHDFQREGFKVRGLAGFKRLDKLRIGRFQPFYLLRPFAEILPSYAVALLAVK